MLVCVVQLFLWHGCHFIVNRKVDNLLQMLQAQGEKLLQQTNSFLLCLYLHKKLLLIITFWDMGLDAVFTAVFTNTIPSHFTMTVVVFVISSRC